MFIVNIRHQKDPGQGSMRLLLYLRLILVCEIVPLDCKAANSVLIASLLPVVPLSNQQFRWDVFTADVRSKLKAVDDRETYGLVLCKRKNTTEIN